MNNEIKRIWSNIDVMLHQGSFPGHFAEGVLEARKFITAMLATLEGSTNGSSTEVSTDTNSAGNQPAAGWMGSDQVPPKGRKGRKRAALPT